MMMSDPVEQRIMAAATACLDPSSEVPHAPLTDEMRQALHAKLADDAEALDVLIEIPAGVWLRMAELKRTKEQE
jgi:hypothetical protein